jgi:cytochrome c2
MPSQPNNALLRLLLPPLAVLAVLGGIYANQRYEAQDIRKRAEALTGGSAERGQRSFIAYGCSGCHSIRGMREARGLVGPPLDGIGGRAIIAGRLENKPSNLIDWIERPQAIAPGTAMPDLGVSHGDARDIAAFLYTRS